MNRLSIKTTVKLNNNVAMPIFGLGTYSLRSGKKTQKIIRYALKVGYRLIDTANIYENEEDVGSAIRSSGIPREEIFVTTKLWNSDHGYDTTLFACERSLKRLDLSYVDLFLIHWPVEELRKDTWKALETLQKEKKCRAIGVSRVC